MIHFLWSIFFLTCSIALALAYIFVGVVIFVLICTLGRLIKEYRLYPDISVAWDDTRVWVEEQFQKRRQSKMLLHVLLLILVFNISIYLKQRIEWMGDDNSNLTAKEYWVAGQVVYGYRNMYCLFNHPDDLFIRPFTWLQEWIYAKGTHYLPENDGERGIWTDVWFVYPYSKKLYNTKGVNGYKPSPRMIELVERAWYAMEKQATGEFADYQMKEQHHFRNFAGQAFYYISKKGFLTGKKVGSRELLVQNPHLLARDRKLLVWLETLKEQWQTSEQTLKFILKNPKVEVFRQLTRLMESGDLVYASIFAREFSCDSPEVRQYVALREEFIGDGVTKTAIQRMADRKQAQRLNNIAINTMIGRFQNYTLERFCDIKVAGEEDMKDFNGWSNPTEEHRESGLKGIFNEEVKILEEMYHGR
jgi:hypothetical protein